MINKQSRETERKKGIATRKSIDFLSDKYKSDYKKEIKKSYYYVVISILFFVSVLIVIILFLTGVFSSEPKRKDEIFLGKDTLAHLLTKPIKTENTRTYIKDRKEDDMAFYKAKKANTIKAYQKYIGDYPNGTHVKEANGKIDWLKKNPPKSPDKEIQGIIEKKLKDILK